MITPFRSDFWKTDAAATALKEAVLTRRESNGTTGITRIIMRREMRNSAKNAVAFARRYRLARAS